MAQAPDYNVENTTNAEFRSGLNAILGAIATNNSGSTEPDVTYPYMWWADTASGLLKLRNAANTDWVTTGSLSNFFASIAITGNSTATTQPLNNDTTRIATTAYVMDAKPQIAIIWDRKAAGTDGGFGNNTAWTPRDLNHKAYDAIGITVASNQFTLPGATKPGQYLVRATAPFYQTERTQLRLFNVTDNTVVTDSYSAVGINQRFGDDGIAVAGSTFQPEISVGFNITANKSYRLEYRLSNPPNSALTLGFAAASNWAVPFEYYSKVEVTYLGNAS